jgi:hypothetical protein
VSEPKKTPFWVTSPEVQAQRELAAKMTEINFGFAGIVHKLDEVAGLLREIRDTNKPQPLPGTFRVKINGEWCEAIFGEEPKRLA